MPSSTPLLPLNIDTPGVSGLTTHGSMTGDVGDWLLTAQNAIYDRDGKIAPRKLFRKMVATNVPTDTIYGTASPDSVSFYAFGENDIYYYNGTGPFTALSTLGNDGNAPGTMVRSGTWQCVQLGLKNYFFHAAKRAKVHDIVTNTFSDVTEAPLGTSIVHSAFGRLWAAPTSQTNQTLYWSVLLIGDDWNGAGSGSLLLSQYMSLGEGITAISDFNDYLLVFTDKQILIFQDPFTVPVDTSGTAGTAESMSLKDRIDGIGCIGRKLVVQVGEELIFLGQNGLNKLSKVIAEGGSNTLADVSLHIKEGLEGHINTAFNTLVYGVNLGNPSYEPEITWHPQFGFLFLSIPDTTNELPQYLIWMSKPTETGYSVTTWGGRQDTGARSEMIYGLQSSPFTNSLRGWLKTGLSENYTTDIGGLGTPQEVGYNGPVNYGTRFTAYDTNPHVEKYTFKMVSPWLSFGPQAETFIKILKRALIAYRTASNPYNVGQYSNYTATALDVKVKIRYDFGTSAREVTFTAPLVNPGAQSGYTDMIPHRIASLPLAGSGSLVQYEISAEISNPSHESFSVQRLSFQAKLGRVHQGI
jgi:hypothetical protein